MMSGCTAVNKEEGRVRQRNSEAEEEVSYRDKVMHTVTCSDRVK